MRESYDLQVNGPFINLPKPETTIDLSKKVKDLEQRIVDLELNKCYRCLCRECTNRTVEGY